MPVDRMRMRPWLEELINCGHIQGLHWVNKEERIFQIPWLHAARHGWEMDKDANLFKNWAVHTGKYQPDKPDPKTWKANFRCALNSLPDIEEVKDQSMKKGSNAFRMYRILSPSERATKKGIKRIMEKEARARRQKAGAKLSGKSSRQRQKETNVETEADSTVSIESQPDDDHSVSDDSVVMSKLQSLCEVVEVTIESRSSPMEPSSPQIAEQPSSSCDDVVNTLTEKDTIEVPQPLDLRQTTSTRLSVGSVLKYPSAALSKLKPFDFTDKINFRVTSLREESPAIAYDSVPWRPFLNAIPRVTHIQTANVKAMPHLMARLGARASVIVQPTDLSLKTGAMQR